MPSQINPVYVLPFYYLRYTLILSSIGLPKWSPSCRFLNQRPLSMCIFYQPIQTVCFADLILLHLTIIFGKELKPRSYPLRSFSHLIDTFSLIWPNILITWRKLSYGGYKDRQAAQEHSGNHSFKSFHRGTRLQETRISHNLISFHNFKFVYCHNMECVFFCWRAVLIVKRLVKWAV